MRNVSLQELINCEELQRLQNEFCRVAGVYACCLNENKDSLTQISNTGSGVFEGMSKDELNALRMSPYAQRAIERVEPGSIEDTAVEHFPGGRVAVLAMYADGEFLFYWMVIDCTNREEGKFTQVLDLLRDIGMSVFKHKMSSLNAEVENQKSMQAQQQMSRDLQRIETTTGIVQLLDCDDDMEIVLDKWLKLFGSYLQAEIAGLVRLNPEERTMEVINSWCNRGVLFPCEKNVKMDACVMYQTEKPLVFSTGGIPGEHTWEADYYGWAAIMVFPVIRQEDGSRIVLTVEFRNAYHNWEASEVKFTADVVKILQSILTKRIQKNSLAGSFAALEAILDNVGSAVYVADGVTGNRLFANRRLRNTFSEELQKKTFADWLDDSIEKKPDGGMAEIRHPESGRWYEVIYKNIDWVDGRRVSFFSLSDITERKLYQNRIEQQAYTDFLTGLYNRMGCERDLEALVKEALKTGETGAVLYLDLDDFKRINDELGHEYGDILLKSIAHALTQIPGLKDSCYRLGGDEFAVIISPKAYVKRNDILGRVKDVFSKPWFLKDADYYCTASMGLVTFPDEGDSVPVLLKKADAAMYEAKKGGKNHLVKYGDSTHSEYGKKLDMEENMRASAADDCAEFEVYFQPIIDIQRSEPVCVGAEALVRYNSQTQGFLTPDEFMPFAEYLGLMSPIGHHVLLEACRHCRRWNTYGHPEYRVHVNISVAQLLQNNIVEQVKEVLRETEMEPSNLILEVTEGLAVNDAERMRGIAVRLKALGVRLALDNFGTGYSSFNHIKDIPFDYIKMDRTVVQKMEQNAFCSTFVRSMTEISGVLGAGLCAVGMEESSQYKVLRDMKVQYVQGNFFDKPMKGREFEKKYVTAR